MGAYSICSATSSTITTPTVIGILVAKSGSFNGALVFVGLTALVAIFSYLVIVGEIRRLDFHLTPPGVAS